LRVSTICPGFFCDIGGRKYGHRPISNQVSLEETINEDFHPAFRPGRRRPVGLYRWRSRAAADRHQVQPCRGADTPKGLAAEFFAKRAERTDQGQGQGRGLRQLDLYKDKEEMEALQLGAVQMLAPSLAKFGPLGVKEFELFDLPYIFDNYAELHKVTQGAVGQSLLKKLEPKGVVGLAFWDNGFKSFSANTPIKMPAT
jgi:TRAP-type C4-dicarboxylate transport system substrate-binding protein